MSRKKKDIGTRTAEVQEELWTEIEFVCPVRGKVKQKVKGLRLKPVEYKPAVYTEDLSEVREVDDAEDI